MGQADDSGMAVVRKKSAQSSTRLTRARVVKVKRMRAGKEGSRDGERAAAAETLLAAESVFRMYDEAEARAKG